MGKYLLSPYATQTSNGHFSASLSIRSGHGEGTHDRVFRFTSEFASQQAAMAYALAQGPNLVPQPHTCCSPSIY